MFKVRMFQAACRSILQHASDDYVKACAQVGLQLVTDDKVKDHSLYLLNNLRHWDGEKARQIKTILRSI